MENHQDLLHQRAALDARIAQAAAADKADALERVHALIKKFQLTRQDLFPRSGKYPSGVHKYRNPKTGATWTGRGTPPSWISGKDRTAFQLVI